MELYCQKRQKLEKSFKIKAIFTKENDENSKCPYLLNKNVSEALNAFFVVSIFGVFFIVWGSERQVILEIPLDFKAFLQKLMVETYEKTCEETTK